MCKNYLEKELYDRMRTSDDIFDFLQAGSLDGLWFWDLEHPENEWMSDRFWTALGYDPATKEHKSKEWQSIIHPDDLKLALHNIELHKSNPSHLYDQVVRYKHADGHTAWIRCRGIVMHDDNGKPVRMLGAHVDVTDLKEAQIEIENYQKCMDEMTIKVDDISKLMGI